MIINQDIHKYVGFKLLSLDLRDTTIMGKSKLFYDFTEPDDEQKLIYTTVIIGANGTGKSNLFRIIIELFKELEDLSKGKGRTYSIDGRFDLKFSIHGDVYQYSNIYNANTLKDIRNVSEKSNTAYLLKNGEIVGFDNVPLPIAIVANSICLPINILFIEKKQIQKVKK